MSKAKVKSAEKEHELEVNAKWSGPEFWKEWGRDKKGSGTGHSGGGHGALYFVGFIGSLIYWFQAASGFMAFVTAILKSLVWPAYVVYKLLEGFYGVA